MSEYRTVPSLFTHIILLMAYNENRRYLVTPTPKKRAVSGTVSGATNRTIQTLKFRLSDMHRIRWRRYDLVATGS